MMIVAISPLHVCCTSSGKVSAVGMMTGVIVIDFWDRSYLVPSVSLQLC